MSLRKEEPIHRYTFSFNPKDNGGEQLTLKTEFFDNGDNEVYTIQSLTLESYCNSASFNLCGAAITPALLRELANQLDIAMSKAKAKLPIN